MRRKECIVMDKVTSTVEQKTRTVFVGNCQAAALAWAYNKYIATEPAEHAASFDGRNLSETAKVAIEEATTLVVQVADLNDEAIRQFDNARGRVVRFPYVSGNFIWPFATEGHIRGKDMPLSEFGAFSDEMGGDKFLNKIFRDGGKIDRAIEDYMGLDIVSAGRLAPRYDLSQRMQRVRDERSGIEISSYMEVALSREPLFATRGHPFSGLFLHLAVQVFDKLGASSHICSQMTKDLRPGPLEQECVPIHPAVIRYFGLLPLRPDGKFLFNMLIQTFEEYISRYMLQMCDPDLMRGRRFFHNGQHAQAVESLLRGLERSPQSPEGERLLSQTLQNLNQSKEALAAAERSVGVDPTNLQSLLHLGQFYLFVRNYEGAILILQRLLELHPGSRDGQRMISTAREFQARHATVTIS
jgi:tetratricopeptide (TPR) repeat protein